MKEQRTPARDGAAPGKATGRPPANVTGHQAYVAMTWVRRGVPVLPCSQTGGKRAKAALVGGFGKEATAQQIERFTDPAWVDQAFNRVFPRAQVGLLTGRSPGRGLLVVDVDPIKPETVLTPEHEGVTHGLDVLRRRMPPGEELPTTYTVRTPSGGQHLYFWQPEDGPLIGCATGDGPRAPHVGPLVDVRGLGGYVIAAGSYSTLRGVAYERISPPGVPVQSLPGWLLEILRPATTEAVPAARPVARPVFSGSRADRYAEAALTGCVQDILNARAGDSTRGRTQTLWWSAVRLGELAATAPHILTEEAVRSALTDAAAAAGVDPRETERQIRAGWTRGIRNGVAA